MLSLFKRRQLVAFVMLTVATISLLITIISWLYMRHFIASAIKTRGTIVEIASDSEGRFKAVFTFHDINGNLQKIYAGEAWRRPPYEVGEVVGVMYPSDDARGAIIENWRSTWAIPIAAGINFAVLFPVGLVLWYWNHIIRIIHK
jgi:hypothetical protein